jgi:hypothetical protein
MPPSPFSNYSRSIEINAHTASKGVSETVCCDVVNQYRISKQSLRCGNQLLHAAVHARVLIHRSSLSERVQQHGK